MGLSITQHWWYGLSMTTENTTETPTARYRAVIPETGQVLDIDGPQLRGRRRKGKRRAFALVDLLSLVRLELTGREWDTLHQIMRAVNPETNEAAITQQEMADYLNIRPANIGRTIKTLRDRYIITTLRPGVHRVNAHIMYRGSTQEWEINSASEREPLWRK